MPVDPVTAITAGKKAYDIGSDIVGGIKSIFGGGEECDLSDDQRKRYFNGHYDRVNNRYADERFFRWHVMVQNDSSTGGWGVTSQGASEINRIIPNGTVFDAYLKLFVVNQFSSLSSEDQQKFIKWVSQGYGEFYHSPKSAQKITQFYINNGRVIQKTNNFTNYSVGQDINNVNSASLTEDIDFNSGAISKAGLINFDMSGKNVALLIGGLVIVGGLIFVGVKR